MWYVLLLLLATPSDERPLTEQAGRREVRLYGGAFPLFEGLEVNASHLVERLERLGYQRVKSRPEKPGRYFWGTDNFYIYQRAHRYDGKQHKARLLALRFEGNQLARVEVNDQILPWQGRSAPYVEPELVAESLEERRVRRVPFRLEDVPEHVWRPLLAAEDSRFFEHLGLDARALARSALANLKAGKVTQGGSTITQQLIKNRDLTPKRTLGRKASEAWRSLWLEANYTKEEILEAYLNHVYLSYREEGAIYGYGAAARAWFNKSVYDLTLAESAAFAAMVQGPNGMRPDKHGQRLKKRRDWVLDRMETLGWETAAKVAAAKREPIEAAKGHLEGTGLHHFRGWMRELVAEETPRRARKGKGVVIESNLDPLLQEEADRIMARHLAELRRRMGLDRGQLQGALICLDARSGAVLAYIGGDPGIENDRFDRARNGERQPGSLVKPFIMLEAYAQGYHGATRVSDGPLTIERPNGPWNPRNHDRRNHGTVSLREALRHSYNLPFVRLGRRLDYPEVAKRFQRAGISVPDNAPPAFLLGAIETTPLEMATAFTTFAGEGRRVVPRPVHRLERPGGRKLEKYGTSRKKVSGAAAAWMTEQLLSDSVRLGSGKGAAIDGYQVMGKTGTSSGGRDAWFAGRAGGLVTLVWIGIDKGQGGGLTGGAHATPPWQQFMKVAVGSRPDLFVAQPITVLEGYVDPKTGLRVGSQKRGTQREYFRADKRPDRKRWWKKNKPEPVIQ